MRVFDLYIVKEWLLWFLCCLGFLLSMLCLFSIADDTSNVFPRGFDTVFFDLLNWAWSYLPWLLPVSCLFAGLITLGFLKKRGEWKAFQANGISMLLCFRSVVLVGFMISYLCWFISSEDLDSTNPGFLNAAQGKPLTMDTGKERLWYFSSFYEENMSGERVQLFQYDQDGADVFRIRAEQAIWSDVEGWSFQNGTFLGFMSEQGVPIPREDFIGLVWEHEDGHVNSFKASKSPRIKKRFKELKMPELIDDPLPFLLLQIKPKKLSFQQLDQLISQFPEPEKPVLTPYLLRRAQIIWTGPACMVALLAGLVFGVSKYSATPGKLSGVALVGVLLFYMIRTFSDSLAEAAIISSNLGAGLPYIVSLLSLLILAKITD